MPDAGARVLLGVRAFNNDADLEPLWDALREQCARNIECSADLLLQDDTLVGIASDLGIHSGYELHSVIFKQGGDLEGLVLGRIPMITLGAAQRDDQILDLIKEMGPVRADSLAVEYENRYGVRAATFRGTCLSGFNLYLKDGAYRYVDRGLTDEESEFLLSQLQDAGGYLTVEYLKERYREHFPESSAAVLNQANVAQFGFSVSGLLFVRSELNMQQLFSQIIDRHDRFDVETEGMSEAVFNNHDFRLALNRLLRRFEVVEYEKDRYLNARVIASMPSGFSALDLKDYLDCAIDFMENDIPYTLKSLKRLGFTHDIEVLRSELDVSDRFFESLLSVGYVGGRVKRTSFGDAVVFCKMSGTLSSALLIERVIAKEGSMGIADLVEYLKEQYGICVTQILLRAIVKRSTLSFCAEEDTALCPDDE